ncbi:hypothetical protein D3C72_1131580 [compost metagenome]
MKNLLPPTYRRLCIIDYFFQNLSSDFPFRNRLIFHEFSQLVDVFLVVKSNTITFTSITTGTASFLIIALHAFRHVVVDHKTHIRFIDTHTKCNGSHNNLNVFHQELILCCRSRISIQTSMVR